MPYTGPEIIQADLKNDVSGGIIGDINKIDIVVRPYGEVKEYLDQKARKTMYDLKKIANDVLSFTGDDDA